MKLHDELRTLVGPALARMDEAQAVRVKRILDRMEAVSDQQEKKYNRAIQDRQAGQSLLRKTSDDLIRRYRAIFEYSGSPMVVMEKDGTISMANTHFCRLVGQPPELVEGKVNISDYLAGSGCDSPYIPALAVAYDSPALRDATPGRISSPGGSVRDVMISVGSLPGSSQLAVTLIDVTDIRRAQESMRKSEQRFRELSELLPQVIFEMDLTGKILYINRAGSEQFGISEKKMAEGISIRDYVSPENYQQLEKGLAAVMAGKRSPGDIYDLKRPDGTIMKAIATTSLIHRDGKIAGFRGIVVDVTERMRLAGQLEESTKLLEGILRASPVGVFQLDNAGRVTFINDMFTTISGMPMDTIRGMHWADILPKEERQRVLAEVDEAVRNRKTAATDFRYIHPDGTPYQLFGQTVPILDSGGNLTGWVGTITDITKQKLAEDALRESEEKYRALTENTPDILFSTDINGTLTYVSPQVNKYGYLVDDVVGQYIGTFIHPLDLPQVESNIARELKEGAQFLSRFRIIDKRGTPYWFEEKSTLRVDLSGKPIGLYGILRDITERKRVEDAIDIANKKLNLMNQITRHDILNTITGLYGCVDMAKATVSPEEKEQLLDEIRELTKVIERHISFTRQYQQVGVHLPQWQNINELIRKVVQNFENSGIIFDSEFEKTEVYADPLLEKVFYNLVDNAVRYGEKLTTISIYPKISDKGFAIVFEDDGVGVPDEQKREIFKHGVGKHTGLGLFLTAEILAITGITIEENGVAGKGARFVIRIPNGTWRLPENKDKR